MQSGEMGHDTPAAPCLSQRMDADAPDTLKLDLDG